MVIWANSTEKISLRLLHPGEDILSHFEGDWYGIDVRNSKEIVVSDDGLTIVQLGMRARKHRWNLKSPVVGE